MQGGPLSPLLANILLDDFDKELESRGLRFVRYADDFLVFTKTREAARRVFASIERYLTRKLKLVVNQQKSRVCSTDGVEFLGFAFQGYGGQFRVARKNLDKFKLASARSRTQPRCLVCTAVRRTSSILPGLGGVLPAGAHQELLQRPGQVGSSPHPDVHLEEWKNGRTRAANLMKLGVAEHEAYTHGMSSKGPWVLSSSQAVHQALSTALLEEWGLPSLSAIWTKLTAKSRTA